MSITWQVIAEMDPSLATVSEPARAIILGDCYKMLDADRWGEYLDLAVRYLAAHTGALSLRGAAGGSTGPVASESLGDASRSYAVSVISASQPSALNSPIWGQQFRMLARGVLPFAIVI